MWHTKYQSIISRRNQMTFEDLRKRVKEIMGYATRDHCKDVSIFSDGPWVTNKLTFIVGCVVKNPRLPAPINMEEHIKFIYKNGHTEDGKVFDIILIHTETVDYDGMIVAPGVQIKLETPHMTPEEYLNSDNARRESLHCTYSDGCGGRLSLKNAITCVAHERTRRLLLDIYAELYLKKLDLNIQKGIKDGSTH